MRILADIFNELDLRGLVLTEKSENEQFIKFSKNIEPPFYDVFDKLEIFWLGKTEVELLLSRERHQCGDKSQILFARKILELYKDKINSIDLPNTDLVLEGFHLNYGWYFKDSLHNLTNEDDDNLFYGFCMEFGRLESVMEVYNYNNLNQDVVPLLRNVPY